MRGGEREGKGGGREGRGEGGEGGGEVNSLDLFSLPFLAKLPVGVSNIIALLIMPAPTSATETLTKQTKLKPHGRLVISILLVLEVFMSVNPPCSVAVMEMV